MKFSTAAIACVALPAAAAFAPSVRVAPSLAVSDDDDDDDDDANHHGIIGMACELGNKLTQTFASLFCYYSE